MTHGIWILAGRVVVMKVKFDVHRQNAQRLNVARMKRLLNQMVNVVQNVKKVSSQLDLNSKSQY